MWQEKVPTIVMVANLEEDNKVKCEKYWPDSGSKNFGPFQVTISEQEKHANYFIRNLIVQVIYREVLLLLKIRVNNIVLLIVIG